MAWLARNDFTPNDKLHADDLNNLANDDRYWGGDVNGGGHKLTNVVLAGSGGFENYVSPLQLTPGADQQSIVQLDQTVAGNQLPRWTMGKENTPESGANAGSNFAIARYDDAGNFLGDPIIITRSSGLITMGAQKWNGPVDGGGFTLSNVVLPGTIPTSRQVIAGPGLAGGGSLAADVTLSAPTMAASGGSHRGGIVPDPGATAGATRFLREDAVWAVPPTGSGGGSGSQTPWTSDIDANGFRLFNAAAVQIGAAAPSPANEKFSVVIPVGKGTAATTGIAYFMSNDASNPFGLQMRLIGAAGLASRSAMLQTGDVNLQDGGNLLLNPGGGNVGIGVSSPGATLDVAAYAVAAQTFPVRWARADGITLGYLCSEVSSYLSGAISLYRNNVANTWISANGTSYFQGGNVAIGQASAAYTLDILAGTGASGALNAFHVNGNTSSLIYMDLQNGNAGNGGNGVIFRFITENSAGNGVTSVDVVKYANGNFVINNNDAAGIIAIGTAGSERVRIAASGRVGIGTPSPNAKLEVSCGNTDGIRITSTQSGFLRFYDTTYGINWGLANDYAANGLFQILAGSGGGNDPTNSIMCFAYTGQVGIGAITAPQQLLHIHAGAYGDAFTQWSNQNGTGPASNQGMIAGIGGGTGPTAYLWCYSNINLNIGTNNATRITVGSNGNIGIGTSPSGYRLEVSGDLNISGTYRVNGTPISGGGGITTQVAQSRALNQTYQNTGGKPIFILISLNAQSGGGINVNCDSQSNPQQYVGSAYNQNVANSLVSVGVWVLPGYYIKTTSSGTCSLFTWIEYY